MTWDTNVKEMSDTWNNFQRQMWANWMDCAAGNPSEQPWNQSFQQSMQLSESMVNMMMDAQSTMTQAFFNNLKPGENTPLLLTQYCEQMRAMADQWNDAMRTASNAWFTAIRDLDKMHSAGELPGACNIFKAWQEAAEKTLAIQSDWAAQLLQPNIHAGMPVTRQDKVAAPTPAADNSPTH